MNNRIYRKLYISSIIYNGRCVAGADADRGLAARIGRPHHTGAAGGKYQIGLLHGPVRQLKAGLLDPRDYALGRTGAYGGVQHYFGRLDGAFFSAGMGAYNNAVACFKGQQRFEYSGRSRVRGGNYCRYDPYRFGYFNVTITVVLFYNAAGLCVFIGVINIFRSIVVFNNLILNNAHAGFFNSHLGERNSRRICSRSSGKEYFIHLLLCKF